MKVFTNEYEWTHGKKPRGYGMWWFSAKTGSNAYQEVVYPGMYSEAKKMAIKWCEEIGGTGLTVMP